MTKSDETPVEDLLPAGKCLPDLTMPHYRYVWTAQYDDIHTGPWVSQFDAEGRERSTILLDKQRTVRIVLTPRVDQTRPTLELRLDPQGGESGRKHWQVDIVAGMAERLVREVLTLVAMQHSFMVYDWEKNRVILATTQDH